MLLGGGVAPGLHEATLRSADGVPYIPGSALKGAIREQMQRLFPTARDEWNLAPGTVDRLLGSQGWPERRDAPVGSLRISDAVLEDPLAVERFRRGNGYGLRTQVSIDRRKRTSSHQRLFLRETVAPFDTDLVFVADVESTLTGKELQLFQGAVRAVFAIGGGRTSGLGRVEMSLADPVTPEKDTKDKSLPDAETLDLFFEAVDPICLGGQRAAGNFHPTLDSIPASALRGAVITAALASQGVSEDKSREEAFQALWIEPESCVRFGEAIPLAAEDAERPSLVAPVTLRSCKVFGEQDGTMDTLVRDAVAMALGRRGVHVALDDDCPVCKGPTTAHPRWPKAGLPEKRVMTRLALDPVTARGSEGQLYSLELLERGTRFVAQVTNVGEEARKWLQNAVAHGLRVGHGRGQGYGRLRLTTATAVEPSLKKRLREFDTLAGPLLSRIDKSRRFYLAATLVSDLAVPKTRDISKPGDPSSPGAVELRFLEALDLSAEILHAAVRTGQRGGFQTLEGRPKPFLPVVKAGSVLLLALPEPPDGAFFKKLENLERYGIGELREEGFGGVRLSDSIHHPGWRMP